MADKATDTLKPESLEWALAHLLKHGDGDLLPVPFEYQAIRADWAAILPKLLERDLKTVSPGAHVVFLVPKPEGAFRVVTRLDPIDAVLYTAAVYECAALIEKSRAAREVACAYRLDPEPDGRLFAKDNGWDAYISESTRLAAAEGITHIVTADISDFYFACLPAPASSPTGPPPASGGNARPASASVTRVSWPYTSAACLICPSSPATAVK